MKLIVWRLAKYWKLKDINCCENIAYEFNNFYQKLNHQGKCTI